MLLSSRFINSRVVTAFGVDAAFSYKYNQLHGICKKDGIVVCPGFTTTHTIPVCICDYIGCVFGLKIKYAAIGLRMLICLIGYSLSMENLFIKDPAEPTLVDIMSLII